MSAAHERRLARLENEGAQRVHIYCDGSKEGFDRWRAELIATGQARARDLFVRVLDF